MNGSTLGIRGFERSLPMALLRAREAVMRQFRPTLTAHGLTEQQWRVLRALADGPRSVGELADATYLLGPSLSRMLASLDERGLVSRRNAGADARRTEVAITPVGLRLVATIGPSSEEQYARIGAHLGDVELAELYRLLARLGDLPVVDDDPSASRGDATSRDPAGSREIPRFADPAIRVDRL